MSDRRTLTFRVPMQCVAHEIAPNGHVENAEMIVLGLSLCYPCANMTLGLLIEGDPSWHSLPALLAGWRHGVLAVAPADG